MKTVPAVKNDVIEKEEEKGDAKGRKIAMKSVVAAKPEKEVNFVLADASHPSLELVQDVRQLRDGAIERNETKANSPRIENPIEGTTSIDDQCIQDVRRSKKRYLDLFVIVIY